jgi:hypothetical protein
MKSPQTALDDLSYVKRALARDQGTPFPAAIAVLWAVVCAVGMPLNDLAPQRAGVFWMVAAPAGFLLSIWLGYRGSRAAGESDRREGMRWALHFGALLLAMSAAALGTAGGAFSGAQLGMVALLVCGTTFLLAGVHLARPLGWVGAVQLAGLPLVLWLPAWRWTVVGAACALALLAIGLAGRRRRGPDGTQELRD